MVERPELSRLAEHVRLEAPQDAGALEALQLQIRRALEQQEEFRKELLEILPREVLPRSLGQTATVTGDDNILIQSAGSGSGSISVSVQR